MKKLSKKLRKFKKALSGVCFLGKDEALEALDEFIAQSKEMESELNNLQTRTVTVTKNFDGESTKTFEEA